MLSTRGGIERFMNLTVEPASGRTGHHEKLTLLGIGMDASEGTSATMTPPLFSFTSSASSSLNPRVKIFSPALFSDAIRRSS